MPSKEFPNVTFIHSTLSADYSKNLSYFFENATPPFWPREYAANLILAISKLTGWTWTDVADMDAVDLVYWGKLASVMQEGINNAQRD